MAIVIGLGNPGSYYRWTRHNAGFQVVDALCSELEGRWKKPFLRPLFLYEDRTRDLLLAKPLTYMNRSGIVLPYLTARQPANPEHILVVVDNLDLPCGRLRMKPQGSDAGHNGIKSIIRTIGTTKFPRLYVGVGPVDGGPLPTSAVDHVLGEFDESEQQLFAAGVQTAVRGCLTWLNAGISAAMEEINAARINPPHGWEA